MSLFENTWFQLRYNYVESLVAISEVPFLRFRSCHAVEVRKIDTGSVWIALGKNPIWSKTYLWFTSLEKKVIFSSFEKTTNFRICAEHFCVCECVCVYSWSFFSISRKCPPLSTSKTTAAGPLKLWTYCIPLKIDKSEKFWVLAYYVARKKSSNCLAIHLFIWWFVMVVSESLLTTQGPCWLLVLVVD